MHTEKSKVNIQNIIEISKKAGQAILEVYDKEFNIENKPDSRFEEGHSPVTDADKRSNEVILRNLAELYPEIPILSEEGKNIPYDERKRWKRFFLVDPLDGTKEFIKKNGEFTVNIALIENCSPILGVVYVPVKDIMYYADKSGSFKEEDGQIIKLPIEQKHDKLMVVASKSHFNQETKDYIENIGKDYGLVNAGSSLKLCLVAEGKADVYPRLGPTMEWDTAAAHAVVKFAGKRVIDHETGSELRYNKENLLNPYFIVK